MIISLVVGGLAGGEDIIYPFAVNKLLNLGRGQLFEAVDPYGTVIFTAREGEGGGLAVLASYLGEIYAFDDFVGVACYLERIEKGVFSYVADVLVEVETSVGKLHGVFVVGGEGFKVDLAILVLLRAPGEEDSVDGDLIALLEFNSAAFVKSDGDRTVGIANKEAIVLFCTADNELGVVDEEGYVCIALDKVVLDPIVHIEE